MFSQFYILGPRGDSIVYRNLRADINYSTSESFFRNVRFYNGTTQEAPPVFNVNGVHYIWIKQNAMFLVLTTISNSSPLLAIEMLNRISKLLKDYLGSFTEEIVRLNFTLIYELLDEVIDWGHPQSTTTDSLKSYVFNEPVLPKKEEILKIDLPSFSTKTTSSASAEKSIVLRDKEKKKNEVFVDVTEHVNISFNSTGQVLNQTIDGVIQMKSYLAGFPELFLSLTPDMSVGGIGPNNTPKKEGAVALDDCNFHECVRLQSFDNDRTIHLVPPEGEFIVMNYRVSANIKAPFRIFPFLDLLSPHKAELVLKIRADIPHNSSGNNVIISVPLPRSATSVASDSAEGQTAEYDSKNRSVIWNIRKFPGAKEIVLRSRITFESATTSAIRREVGPINLTFEIPMYSASGLQIKHLQLRDSKADPPVRWIRYITKAHSYTCRM